jgi:nucleoid-associated protein YgaU
MPGAPRQNVDLGKDPLTEYFTVGANDNFWKISKQVYGTSRYYLALTRFNEGRVPDPQRLRPGTLISTPPRAVLDQRFPGLIDRNPVTPAPAAVAPGIRPAAPAFAGPGHMPQPQSPTAAPGPGSSGYFLGPMGQPLYRVGPDDTLTSISQRHLGRASRWTEIFAQNRDRLKTPDRLQQGTVLRLPPDASQLSVMPGRERR